MERDHGFRSWRQAVVGEHPLSDRYSGLVALVRRLFATDNGDLMGEIVLNPTLATTASKDDDTYELYLRRLNENEHVKSKDSR